LRQFTTPIVIDGLKYEYTKRNYLCLNKLWFYDAQFLFTLQEIAELNRRSDLFQSMYNIRFSLYFHAADLQKILRLRHSFGGMIIKSLVVTQ